MSKPFRVAVLLGVMRALRPLMGPINMCIYREYTCTDYAIDQLNNHSLFVATLRIVWRFATCNPITLLVRRFTCKKEL